MDKHHFLTIIGALVSVAGAIGPQISELNPKAGVVISIIGLAAAALGKSLMDTDKKE